MCLILEGVLNFFGVSCWMVERGNYPSDEAWAFVAPYLCLMREDAPQREYPWREVFNALRWLVRAGAPWRLLPHDLPPWRVVYQQTRRWIEASFVQHQPFVQVRRSDMRYTHLEVERPSLS
jgi:Putative transposase of IS4/5 family (DUF4096)